MHRVQVMTVMDRALARARREVLPWTVAPAYGNLWSPDGQRATRSFSFYANGSTTSDGINEYVYDTRGRLVQSTGVLGVTIAIR